MTVTRHLKGSRGSWNENGLTYNERVKVTGIVAADFGLATYAAFTDAQMPAHGSSLTLGAATVYVSNRVVANFAFASGVITEAYVDITYSPAPAVSVTTVIANDNGPGTSTVGSVVETTSTDFDVNGNELLVKATPTSDSVLEPVVVRLPNAVIEFGRLEVNSPRDRATTHVGTTNSGTWNGYVANTILCTGITGTTRDGGVTYDVRYSFEQRIAGGDGWDVTVVYKDPRTNKPITPLVDGVSKDVYQIYPQSNFGLLNISL